MLESVYEAVLASELTGRGMKVVRQVPVAIEYKGIKFDEGFRADLIVEDRVILELRRGCFKDKNHPLCERP